MTDRVQRLLARARQRTGAFWTRRPLWEEALAQHAHEPVPVRRALALAEVLARCEAVIGEDEFLAGTHPASPVPPAERELRGSRPRQDGQAALRLPEERAALQAGLFTSSNKPDHLTVNYPRLLAEGIDGLLARIANAGEETVERRAMRIGVEAFQAYIERYAVEAARCGEAAMAQTCERVAHVPPTNLREALQLVWFTFLVQCIENGESTGAFALGRFDQYLGPFWQADLSRGVDRAELVELVGCFWVKLNEFVPRGLASAVLNLTIGGSLADGTDGVNDLSYACLDLMHEFRTVTPSLSVRWHPGIDPVFFQRAVALATEGFGQPAFYGDPAAIQAMTHAGVAPADAVNVVPGGCVELGVQGCCHPWVGNFFNLPKCLELALFDGIDPRSGQRLGPATGTPAELDTFPKLFAAFSRQVAYFLDLMARSDCTTDRLAGEHSPFPFLSALVDDCIATGRDMASGGARYNFTEVQGIGIANVVDSLLNVRELVYERGELAFPDLLATLQTDFADAEPLRRRLAARHPAYGDGEPEIAELAREVVHTFFTHCEGRPNPRGGTFRPGLLVWTLFTDWANTVGALPDGRRRGEPLVSSIGPRNGGDGSPTAIIADATAFDQFHCAGGLTLNLRFDASTARTATGRSAIAALLEGYFQRGGIQVQVNVTDSALLRAAQADPAQHPGLLVRVSGFCARFHDLPAVMQDEIIARAELRTAP